MTKGQGRAVQSIAPSPRAPASKAGHSSRGGLGAKAASNGGGASARTAGNAERACAPEDLGPAPRPPRLSTAYPKASPAQPQSNASYSGPPLGPPSRQGAALRARAKAAAGPQDDLCLLFGSTMMSESPPPKSPPLALAPRERRASTAEYDPENHAPRRFSLEAKAPAPRKRSGAVKKRRGRHQTTVTSMQPFSFSTDGRGRRVRPTVVQDGALESRPKLSTFKARAKYSSIVAVPKHQGQNSPPSLVAATPLAAPEPTPGTEIDGVSQVSTSPVTSASAGNGATSARGRFERPQPATVTRQTPAGMADDVPSSPERAREVFARFAGSSSSSPILRSRHIERLGRSSSEQISGEPPSPRSRMDMVGVFAEDDDNAVLLSSLRTRSHGVLRGRPANHLGCATAAHQEASEERHVSFSSEQNVEVVHFDDHQAPPTTRMSRRVFGGDLSAGSSAATNSAVGSLRQGLNTFATNLCPMGIMASGTRAQSQNSSVEKLPNVSSSSTSVRPGIRDLSGVVPEMGLL